MKSALLKLAIKFAIPVAEAAVIALAAKASKKFRERYVL